jgi:hypothetical protein
MKLHPLDWILIVVAGAAVVVGVLLNGPSCDLPMGPDGASGCTGWHFPVELVSGAGLAVIALAIVAVRVRRRPNSMIRFFGAVAAVALIALAAYLTGPRLRVVCYGGGTVTDCARAADAVLADAGGGRPIAAVAVYAWRGCPPGAYCGLVEDPLPAPFSALVGIRFADGTHSLMRDVGDLAAHPIAVHEIEGYQPDQFIDGVLGTRGASETWVRQPIGW